MVHGCIVKAKEQQGTRWLLPYTLKILRFGFWRVLGRYPSDEAARAAARRRGLVLESGTQYVPEG